MKTICLFPLVICISEREPGKLLAIKAKSMSKKEIAPRILPQKRKLLEKYRKKPRVLKVIMIRTSVTKSAIKEISNTVPIIAGSHHIPHSTPIQILVRMAEMRINLFDIEIFKV